MMQTLWDGGPVLEQMPGVFPMGTDSILLADFARPGKRDRILDLGTGSGILPVLLLSQQDQCTALALEKDPVACGLAQRNLCHNQLSDRATILSGDLREYRQILKTGGFDLTVSNPPYFPQNRGPPAGSGLREARGEDSCTIAQLCQAAAWATRWGGRFCLVFRPERLPDLICALRENGLEPKRLRPVHHAQGLPVNLILLEARRGGNPGLTWENDLYLYHPDGTETPELRRIYRRP
jgi:tRNA1(Val) A37 N6-methylase TrmN6